MSLELLDVPYRLARSDVYTTPGSAGTLLPVVYGGFDEIGFLETVQIDKDRWIYLIADHPIDAVTEVWIGGKKLTTGYTAETSASYQSHATISYVALGSDPGGELLVRCRGAKIKGTWTDAYVDVIEAILLDVFGLTEDDLDADSWTRARQIAADQDYQAAIRIDQERTPAEWLADWLRPVNGSAWVEAGRLHLRLDDGTGKVGEKVALVAGDYRDVEIESSAENLASRVLVQFGWDPSSSSYIGTGEQYFSGSFPFVQLVSAGKAEDRDALRWYGEREVVIEARTVMHPATATNLAANLLKIYKDELVILRVTDISRKAARARLWDALQVDLSPWHPDASIATRNWRIVGRAMDPRTGAIRFTCVDTRTNG